MDDEPCRDKVFVCVHQAHLSCLVCSSRAKNIEGDWVSCVCVYGVEVCYRQGHWLICELPNVMLLVVFAAIYVYTRCFGVHI